jgi:hypothetical protein
MAPPILTLTFKLTLHGRFQKFVTKIYPDELLLCCLMCTLASCGPQPAVQTVVSTHAAVIVRVRAAMNKYKTTAEGALRSLPARIGGGVRDTSDIAPRDYDEVDCDLATLERAIYHGLGLEGGEGSFGLCQMCIMLFLLCSFLPWEPRASLRTSSRRVACGLAV